jgi:hypothetical protein
VGNTRGSNELCAYCVLDTKREERDGQRGYCGGGGLGSIAEPSIRMINPEHEQLSQT